jgi:thiamine biosynthesis protein ThiS
MSDRIRVQVNGEGREVRDGLTVHDLLLSLDLRPAMVVVEHNGDILRRERYTEVRVAQGDALELVHFVGGG